MIQRLFSGTPSVVEFLVPSVTPWRARVTPTIIKQARNPALRAVEYDKDSLEILNIKQYYVDLMEANKKAKATWKLEYNIKGEHINTSTHQHINTSTHCLGITLRAA